MQPSHWVMLVVMLIVGYLLGRMFPQLGQTVGLP